MKDYSRNVQISSKKWFFHQKQNPNFREKLRTEKITNRKSTRDVNGAGMVLRAPIPAHHPFFSFSLEEKKKKKIFAD